MFILVLMYQDDSAIQAHETSRYVVDFAENKMHQLCKTVKWFDGYKIF